MNIDLLIRKTLEFSQIKIIKFFLQIFEVIIFWYYSKQFKKRKKINSKFFIYFQFFCGAKIASLYRRRKHEILTEKLDLNLEIDKKINAGKKYHCPYTNYIRYNDASYSIFK